MLSITFCKTKTVKKRKFVVENFKILQKKLCKIKTISPQPTKQSMNVCELIFLNPD